MNINRLCHGDCIGIVCPSHIASEERYEKSIATLKALGFRVKAGQNIYKDTYGYLATEMERASDFNDMIRDNEVKMILFGGGEGGGELIPYLDYEGIRQHPKLVCGFSDGTSILNAIHAMTGLTTYYGQGPGVFYDLRHFDYLQFCFHFLNSSATTHMPADTWITLHPGTSTGLLMGGYTRNFALMLGNKHFTYDKSEKYILFLEDHERFSNVAKVSSFISHIEQTDFISCVSGLIFGHYAEEVPGDLLKRLERFGEKYDVPVVYTDDFGHGKNHALFPIGGMARLDAKPDGPHLVLL